MSTVQPRWGETSAHGPLRPRKARDAARGRAAYDEATRDDRTRATVLVLAAVAWLVVGCCGLLWTIAFTADPRSMVVGLAVWVFCFVAPSTLATAIACRLDESAASERMPRGRSHASASAGD